MSVRTLIIILIFVSSFFTSCKLKNKINLEGDLYFQMIDFHKIYSDKPFIRLVSENNEKMILFMDSNDYAHFEQLNCNMLRSENKKIHVIAKVEKIADKKNNSYKVIKIESIEKLDGKTECYK